MNCPLCNSEAHRRKGKYGMFWGCSAFPKCKWTQSIPKEEETESEKKSEEKQSDYWKRMFWNERAWWIKLALHNGWLQTPFPPSEGLPPQVCPSCGKERE